MAEPQPSLPRGAELVAPDKLYRATDVARLGFEEASPIAGKHEHFSGCAEGDGLATRIGYADARRFGFMGLIPTAQVEAPPWFAGLGPEPLGNGFSGAHLAEAFAGKSQNIKVSLLDQRIVAGLGNIYVCEALFRAGISPKRLARTVAGARAEKLVPIIKTVLKEAIKAGGSSLRDYAHTDGELGYFQHSFKVYDREGEPCPTCGAAIKRIVQSGRSTFYCGHCQK